MGGLQEDSHSSPGFDLSGSVKQACKKAIAIVRGVSLNTSEVAVGKVKMSYSGLQGKCLVDFYFHTNTVFSSEVESCTDPGGIGFPTAAAHREPIYAI